MPFIAWVDNEASALRIYEKSIVSKRPEQPSYVKYTYFWNLFLENVSRIILEQRYDSDQLFFYLSFRFTPTLGGSINFKLPLSSDMTISITKVSIPEKQ